MDHPTHILTFTEEVSEDASSTTETTLALPALSAARGPGRGAGAETELLDGGGSDDQATPREIELATMRRAPASAALSAGGNHSADHEHGAASARLPVRSKEKVKATTEANPDNDEDDLGG